MPDFSNMDVASYHDDHNAILILREFIDPNTCRITTSTMDFAKTISQICQENELPISSTYKKIRKLCKSGLISVEKINIDDKGLNLYPQHGHRNSSHFKKISHT